MSISNVSVYHNERTKYERVWSEIESYGDNSFGERLVDRFIELCNVKAHSNIIDIGCGSGKAAKKLKKLNHNVIGIDCVEIYNLVFEFWKVCLWKDWFIVKDHESDYGFCCDVLEHIPTEFTMLVVEKCLTNTKVCFFHINFEPDIFGQEINDILHLTVKPFTWWRDNLAEMGKLTTAIDMLSSGIFILERN